MTDFGDEVQSAQERHLRRSLTRMGINVRDIEIPPPTFEVPPATADQTSEDDQ